MPLAVTFERLRLGNRLADGTGTGLTVTVIIGTVTFDAVGVETDRDGISLEAGLVTPVKEGIEPLEAEGNSPPPEILESVSVGNNEVGTPMTLVVTEDDTSIDGFEAPSPDKDGGDGIETLELADRGGNVNDTGGVTMELDTLLPKIGG